MSERRSRNYWRAVNQLRTAETLANLQAVAGPADAAPEDGKEPSWLEDWTSRAKEALKKARDWATSEKKAAKDRARRIARAVHQGVRDVWRASPPGKLADSHAKAMTSLANAAQAIQWASLIGSGVATVALLAAVWWVWSRKG